MTQLPIITVTPYTEGGWMALCDTCGWWIKCVTRPAVDHAGIEHRRVCAKRRRD